MASAESDKNYFLAPLSSAFSPSLRLHGSLGSFGKREVALVASWEDGLPHPPGRSEVTFEATVLSESLFYPFDRTPICSCDGIRTNHHTPTLAPIAFRPLFPRTTALFASAASHAFTAVFPMVALYPMDEMTATTAIAEFADAASSTRRTGSIHDFCTITVPTDGIKRFLEGGCILE